MEKITRFFVSGIFLLAASMPLFAEEPAQTQAAAAQKHPTLEEMSPEEFRKALKQSHAEITNRLGGSSFQGNVTSQKAGSMSEKRAYETSARSRIEMLSHKIDSLQNHYYDNWGYAQRDAQKLRELQWKARDYLLKIQLDDTEGWRTHQNALESILRQTADY